MERTPLRDFVFDLAENGIRADLNPTTPAFTDEKAAVAWYRSYLNSIEETLQNRAKEALRSESLLDRLGADLCTYCYNAPAMPRPRAVPPVPFHRPKLCQECASQWETKRYSTR